MMQRKIKNLVIVVFSGLFWACKTPVINQRSVNKTVPSLYFESNDTLNTASVLWKDFFHDPLLNNLIETAIENNQELNIVRQEIEISRNEIMARKGEYMPFVNIGGGAGAEKVGRYTSQGASDASTEMKPGKEVPEFLPDFKFGAFASWELDIWHKLRNAKKSAMERYLASQEGKNFLQTQLIAEIADTYYELIALDNQLIIVKQNIEIQSNALNIVRVQKEAARATELAVKKFEAEVFKTRSLQFEIQQKIVEAENKINFLVGRYPQPVERTASDFETFLTDNLQIGVPLQLLENRPDVRQAEHQLEAAKLDILVAKANFYPSLGLSAGIGLQAFNPVYLAKIPESILANLAADMMGPLINKNAITAMYYNANATQTQAILNYERTLLNAFLEVKNQVSKVENLKNSFSLKQQQVAALNASIDISNRLFRSARADYMEVLMTQRDALESRFDLVETKKEQLTTRVNVYKALGGGWR